jgi:hypothetical protein
MAAAPCGLLAKSPQLKLAMVSTIPICFGLISGLSSIAFVYAGPDNVDMTVVAVVLGLLSPALAVMIATTSGLIAVPDRVRCNQSLPRQAFRHLNLLHPSKNRYNALSNISGAAQAGNVALGLGSFKPGNRPQ